MTYKIFNNLFTFDFRNGVGIDLEFVNGRAIWVSRGKEYGLDVEAASFVGTVILLPFMQLTFGKAYAPDDEEELEV